MMKIDKDAYRHIDMVHIHHIHNTVHSVQCYDMVSG
jgi:hypothetical protein